MEVDGASVDLSALKPRVRTLLRLLAANAGRPVHREVIQHLLWPEADADSATRNLHVAMSTLRQALAPLADVAGGPLLTRDGDAYRLAPGCNVEVDLIEFDEALNAARRAQAAGDAGAAFKRALDLYGGELLPEEGPADWVIELRARCLAGVVEASQAVAMSALESGDPEEAARASVNGLRVDRYADTLWRLLIKARQLAGDRLAASRTMAEYEQVLRELGLPPATAMRRS